MKVKVIDSKTGREKEMAPRYASILNKIGRVTYMTRDMAAVPFAPAPRVGQPVPHDELDGLEAEELHALAKQRGVKVHHKAGAEKVRDALRESAE